MPARKTGFREIFVTLFADLPEIENVERRTEVIKGPDGNEIRLYIHQPKDASGPSPCVYHIHGGGMAILQATDSQFPRWRDELSALGMVVVGVEFRNAAGELGNHPFPAGLNDCMSGLQWERLTTKPPSGSARSLCQASPAAATSLWRLA